MPQNFIEKIQALLKFSSEILLFECAHFNTVIFDRNSKLARALYGVAKIKHRIDFITL